MLSFEKEYVYRSGDRQPTPDVGCTLDEATIALACAHSDVGLAVQAKREVGRLYDSIEQPPYTLLFNASVSAQRVWRAVEVTRCVDTKLRELELSLSGKERLIAIHGNRFVLHMVLMHLEPAVLNEPGVNLSETLAKAGPLTEAFLNNVTVAAMKWFPSAYPANVFKNVSKCKRLVSEIESTEAQAHGVGVPPQGSWTVI